MCKLIRCFCFFMTMKHNIIYFFFLCAIMSVKQKVLVVIAIVFFAQALAFGNAVRIGEIPISLGIMLGLLAAGTGLAAALAVKSD
jgi:hypothetical protein